MEIKGLEPSTYGLQSRRSSQLSYIPVGIYEFLLLKKRNEIGRSVRRTPCHEMFLGIPALYMIVLRLQRFRALSAKPFS